MKKYILVVLFWTNALMAMPLEINQDHSKLLFDIDYMKLTTVQGQFKKYSGTFNFTLLKSDFVKNHETFNGRN
jgi:polyisoprenoid-binding protein YceI